MTDTGHIYKIICLVEPTFCYIGSTFNRLSKRFEMHRGNFNRWLKDKTKSKCACYPYFEKYGIENFKIVLIKSYEVCREHIKDRRHLEAFETLWINRHRGKCCNMNAPLRLLKKEKKKEYREKNKELIAEKKKKHYEKNKEQIVEQKKEYYEDNKEQIAEKKKKKIQCECGCAVTKNDLSRHKKSPKHQKLMAQK